MQLKKIHVKNFRLLHDAALLLEKKTTVIVGRNNSGKTSLTEVISRLLGEGNTRFSLEDFSCVSRPLFWDAYLAKIGGAICSALGIRPAQFLRQVEKLSNFELPRESGGHPPDHVSG